MKLKRTEGSKSVRIAHITEFKSLPFVSILGLFFIFSYGSAKAEEGYILYGVSKYLLLYYSPNSITRPAEKIVRLKIKQVTKCNDSKDWTVKESPNCQNVKWAYVLTTTEINCRTKQDHDLESTGYDSKGSEVASLDTEDSEWNDIIPDSYTDALYRLVCSSNEKKSPLP